MHSKILNEAIMQKQYGKGVFREIEGEKGEQYEREKVLKIEHSQRMHCCFCRKYNHRTEDCLKLKRFNEFKEFIELCNRGEQKESAKKRFGIRLKKQNYSLHKWISTRLSRVNV